MFSGDPDLICFGLVLETAEDAIKGVCIKFVALIRWDTDMIAEAKDMECGNTGLLAIEGLIGS